MMMSIVSGSLSDKPVYRQIIPMQGITDSHGNCSPDSLGGNAAPLSPQNTLLDTTPYGMRENAHEEAHTHVLGVG
jgi:hypothetical protein